MSSQCALQSFDRQPETVTRLARLLHQDRQVPRQGPFWVGHVNDVSVVVLPVDDGWAVRVGPAVAVFGNEVEQAIHNALPMLHD